MSTETHPVIDAWHKVVQEKDIDKLDALLDDHCVFHSPVVHTPQSGKAITKIYLGAAAMVLANDSFSYVREIIGENNAALEFETELEGIHINGVDLIRWNAAGKIIDFKVMVRPLKAVNKLHEMMKAMLSGGK